MNSIRLRLTAFFIVVTTITLGIFGAYSQIQLSRDLEERFQQLKKSVTNRLQINLSGPLWGFDIPIISRIIAAEMTPQEIRGIYLMDSQSSVLVGFARNGAGKFIPSLKEDDADGLPVKSPIFTPDIKDPGETEASKTPPQGFVIVYFSRDKIEGALRADLLSHVLQVLIADLMLIFVLTLSLRMVFGPLARLRDAQFELARQDSENMNELPPTRRTELDELTKGFNETLLKLKQVIKRRTEAESYARASANETREAMEKLKAAQEDLVKAGKMAALGSLVAGIAHELNTPIGNGLMAATTLHEHTDAFQLRIS